MSNEELIEILRKRLDRAGTQIALARELGVGQPLINDVLSGRREVSPRLAEALGFAKETVFIPKK
jgi:DNA-binding transcriptional regulator YdaS (Cro superfamily)